MNKKFNLKLTAFLVSLFISLIVLICGNKNQYCLSFGFMLLGVSAALFVLYNDEKTIETINEIDKQIEEVDASAEVDEEEKIFVMQQFYLRQSKLLKRKKKVALTFYLCAALLVVLGIIAIF